MKKGKSVGTPKNKRVRKGALLKRGTLGVDRGPKVALGKSFDDAADQMRKGRSTQMPGGLKPARYTHKDGRLGMDPAWGSDILDRLKDLEEVFKYLGVCPSYYKSHLYYLRETVHELLDRDGVWGG